MVSKALKREIITCVHILNSRGTILYPTDTIWGIGCDATNTDAVNKVFRIKKRKGGKSLIILLDSTSKLSLYVETIPLITWDLLKNIATPLTIIFPRGRNLAPNVLGEDGSVAIRIPNHRFCREMLREFGKPVVSTSANFSGETPPHAFNDIDPAIIENVDYTVSLYHDFISAASASRIIKLYENGEFNVIRQ